MARGKFGLAWAMQFDGPGGELQDGQNLFSFQPRMFNENFFKRLTGSQFFQNQFDRDSRPLYYGLAEQHVGVEFNELIDK